MCICIMYVCIIPLPQNFQRHHYLVLVRIPWQLELGSFKNKAFDLN